MGSLVVVLVVGRHVSHLLQRVLILDADAEKGLLYLAQVIDLPGQKTPDVADDKNLGLDERRLTAFVGRGNLLEGIPGDENNKAADGELERGEFALQPEEGEQALDGHDYDTDILLDERGLVGASLTSRHFVGLSWIRVVALEMFFFQCLHGDDLQLLGFRWWDSCVGDGWV